MISRVTQKILLAIACCFALVAFVPLSVGAQTPGGIIKKGAQGVQKGVETGVDKTKEGAEAVGKGVKDAVTGDDSSDTQRTKSTETKQTTPSDTTKPSSTTKSKDMSTKSTTATSSTSEGKRLPATAGELPFLALVGGFALAASAVPKIIRQFR